MGSTTIDLGLASPASGPVGAVWFSAEGGRLFARLASGRIFETSDFENWVPSVAPPPHPETVGRFRLGPRGSQYRLGADLSRSDDRGRTWIDLTGFNGKSIIGPGVNDIAISPGDPQTIFVANDSGVWGTHDGGQSWAGFNEGLPNLPVREILATGSTVKAAIDGIGASTTESRGEWEPAGSPSDGRSALSAVLKVQVTAIAGAAETWYAGSADGRIWVSRDNRATWTVSPNSAGAAIERLFVDPDAPRIAFAAAPGRSRSLLRTINAGQFWDDITGNLADTAAHGITADRASGFIYAATDKGVFSARADLNVIGPVYSWVSLNWNLPAAPAFDVKLKATGDLLYASLDGYGVYETTVRRGSPGLRLVNSADLSDRSAAPGSLYSVMGGRVQSARAGSLNVPVLGSSDESSQIQVPFEATGSQISLTLEQATRQIVMPLTLKPVSPAIFLDRDGAPLLVDRENGLMLDAKSIAGPHSRLQILATGLGRTTPAWPTAVPAPENPPVVSASVQAFLNGNPLEVTSATLAPGYVGLYLVEIELPALLDAGPGELYFSADGQESNRVRVYLRSE